MSNLWEKLPVWVKRNVTVRAEIVEGSESVGYDGPKPWRHEPLETANMITSKIDEEVAWIAEYHTPILDLDFDAKLLPSSTPGHWHLFLDTSVPHGAYMRFLEAAAEAGIIQYGYYKAAKDRGASSVRLPWIKKSNKRDNSLNPNEVVDRVNNQIETLRAQLNVLEGQRDRLLEEDRGNIEVEEEVVW